MTRRRDPGAYIGHEPELAAETIPGGVKKDDERVAAHSTQSGPVDDRGRDDRAETSGDDRAQKTGDDRPEAGQDR